MEKISIRELKRRIEGGEILLPGTGRQIRFCSEDQSWVTDGRTMSFDIKFSKVYVHPAPPAVGLFIEPNCIVRIELVREVWVDASDESRGVSVILVCGDPTFPSNFRRYKLLVS